MKKIISFPIATLLLLVLACSREPGGPDSPLAAFGKAPKVEDPTSGWLIPVNTTGLALASDGNYLAGGYSVYNEGVCGVHSQIFATAAASGSGDAIMHTDNPRYSDRKCKDYPRTVTLTFPDGSVETTTMFGNVHEVRNGGFSIPVGSMVTRALNITTGGARCGVLKYRATGQAGTFLGGDEVLVTRLDAGTWDVSTQADDANGKHDRAYCDNTGELLSMPLHFLIVSSTPLP